MSNVHKKLVGIVLSNQRQRLNGIFRKSISILKSLFLFIVNFLWNRLQHNWQPICLLMLFLISILGTVKLFEVINKVPNRRIGIEIDKEGDSESSLCKVVINANFEKEINKKDLFNSRSNKEEICNVVYINHHNASGGIPLYKRERSGLLLIGYPNHIENYDILRKKFPSQYKSLYTAYSVRYKIGIKDDSIAPEEEKIDSANGTYNISKARICEDDEGLIVDGVHMVAFKNCSGADTLFFANQSNNVKQNFLSSWDVSQSNYRIRVSTTRIHCEKIIVDFHQPVNFSMMYPVPDKVTAKSIEFTSQEKINELGDIGLFFHVEFVETKTIQDVRNFILTAIMSIVVAFFCGYIIEYIKKHRQ